LICDSNSDIIYTMSILKLDKTALNILQGDAKEKLCEIPDDSIDFIFTSPPYAEQRKGKYEGVPADKYIEWFIPIAKEIKRILKPTGSFLLNIKSHCEKGERSLYVYELIVAIKKEAGLKFVDEYVWYKSKIPMRNSHRLPDAWEPIFHFSKEKNFINHDAIKIRSESTFGSKRGYSCYNEQTGNIGGYHDIADQVSGWTTPDNILYFPTALLVKDKYKHPAKFPIELAEFLIKAFCPAEGTICDPFCGSGTTALAALKLDRKCIAIEIANKYCKIIKDRIESYRPTTIKKPQSNNLSKYGVDPNIDLFRE